MKYILTEKNNSYGIALVLEQENKAETVEAYENLTTDKARIEELVNDCNELSLDPIHLKDIVADFKREISALV